MQYHAIPCNTMQYQAIPCMLNNCWRSVPLPCWQYMAIFLLWSLQLNKEFWIWLWISEIEYKIFLFLSWEFGSCFEFFKMTSHWQEWRDRLRVKLEYFYNYCVFHFKCSNMHYVVIISLHIYLTIIPIQISFHPGAMFPGRASWVMGVCLCQAMARSQQIIQDFGHLKTYDLIIFSKWFSGRKPGSNSTSLNAITALSAVYVYITIVLLRRLIK